MGKSEYKFDHIAEIIYVRYPWFECLQAIQAILIYFPCATLIFSLPPSTPRLDYVRNFLYFLFALDTFNTCLFMVSSPPPVHRLSPLEYLRGLLKLVFVNEGKPLTSDYRKKVWLTSKLVIFVSHSGMAASLSIVSINGFYDFRALGLRGFVAGLIYASHYTRWVLDFPIVQRATFFRYKLGVRKAIIQAVKLSTDAYLLTLALSIFTNYYKGQLARGDLIKEQIVFYLACVVVFLCWELNRNLLQVILTQRLAFAPPKGLAVVEANSSDHLLTVLEDTNSVLHVRCHAYYDLCMVSESNVDTWRRAALFEETGETYKRVITVCLKPLEQLTLDLSSDQLCVPNELNEPFYEFQIFAWCACIVSSLTVCSHKEDRFGVAHVSGSNVATISTLLSSLLVVETLTENKKDSPHYCKAYSMADILRTSVYQIVSVFHQEIVASSKAGRLQKDWITSDKPLYGSYELLVQKLQMFLEFQAN